MKSNIASMSILLLVLLGLVPALWFRQDSIIASGDYFPFSMNIRRTLVGDLQSWTPNNLGNPSVYSASLFYELAWLFLGEAGLSVGMIQIIFQMFLLLCSGLSMYFLARTVYPESELASPVSGVFYMFNMFVLQSRLNNGMAWTYAFLPMLMGLFIRFMEAAHRDDSSSLYRNSCLFAVVSTIAFSVASANLANIVLVIVVLGLLSLYYIIKGRKGILLFKISLLAAVVVLVNLWWIIPTLNFFALSPSVLNPEISVATYVWTHDRASFLNLFWLNGFWGWREEYVPYIGSYSSPIMIMLTFIPILLASAASLFKTNKSRSNAFFMLVVLAFFFLAKGFHEPLGQLNLLLYDNIPGMMMFREPVSKFTMALMPFLALLVGYAVSQVANVRIRTGPPSKTTRTLIVTFFIITFIVAAYPLILGPIETKTERLPFSSYVEIPDYWYKATDWLDAQQGNYRVLVTPSDDYYQMPYNWGYYGTDQFLERLITKPIISNYYTYYYKTNPEIALTLQQLYDTIRQNRTDQFKAFLDLLNVKYILQRNDVGYIFTGRNIMSPSEMQSFLAQQSYIRLAQEFGELDIYEYAESKPYAYVLDPSILQQTEIEIENVTTLERIWNFTLLTEVQEWENATPRNQWQTICTITQEQDTLRAELWNSTWGWKTINSPILPAQYGCTYQIQAMIRGENAHEAHLKMAEYDENRTILTAVYTRYVNDGTFNWTHINFEYEPIYKKTKYIQIQIWHGHETPLPIPNVLWIDNIRITGNDLVLKTIGLELVFPNTIQNQPGTIIGFQRESPTKITVRVNAIRPFIMGISEALDGSWNAYANGTQYQARQLFLGLGGFLINKTGNLVVTIEYIPQQWFSYAAIVSVSSFLVCMTYLVYSLARNSYVRVFRRTQYQKLKPSPVTPVGDRSAY